MTEPHPDNAFLSSPPAEPQVHDALELTGGAATALIRMNDQTWTLRITRQGKLILTK